MSYGQDMMNNPPTPPQVIATIEGNAVNYWPSPEKVSYTAKMAIDGDGRGGNTWSDPDFQPDTTLHFNGAALDSETECYIVVPPIIIQSTKGIVLGCQAFVSFKEKKVAAVVGDIGPHLKLGEGSIELARQLGIPASPLSGGVDSGVFYEILPGVPAIANGKTYSLQPA